MVGTRRELSRFVLGTVGKFNLVLAQPAIHEAFAVFGVETMSTQTNKIVLRGTSVEVSLDGDEVVALTVNGTPVFESPYVEKGDIVVKHAGTPEAYIATDSFETLRRALKLLEPTRRRA